MLFYHYSSKPYHSLQSRMKQGLVTQDQRNRELRSMAVKGEIAPYSDNISLFIEPAPLDIIASVFSNRHEFWVAGRSIYEHVVDLNDIERNITYELTETPDRGEYVDQFDWDVDDTEVYRKYHQAINKWMLSRKLAGRSRADMMAAINPYLGKTRSFYIATMSREDYEENLQKYAASVPHLMVYPSSGELSLLSVSKVTLGSKKVTRGNAVDVTKWMRW